MAGRHNQCTNNPLEPQHEAAGQAQNPPQNQQLKSLAIPAPAASPMLLSEALPPVLNSRVGRAFPSAHGLYEIVHRFQNLEERKAIVAAFLLGVGIQTCDPEAYKQVIVEAYLGQGVTL